MILNGPSRDKGTLGEPTVNNDYGCFWIFVILMMLFYGCNTRTKVDRLERQVNQLLMERNDK